ncbi:hypothetical protein CHU92_02880 [Flavobacterium cyanobacteriorum]|uniref:Uncharacterized protein n=1 Tax=Flavobacterium cyanobacteriorum TaxID=2022802 RepID=A0A255ZQM1_9FLAO|nr:hypothetical protein [Flavobacterium cyanobacteriorum]OYQ43808.1 hypothetical protein CHU92_02880 [Flavobacterium cyanobacteriorum]
MDLGYLKLKIDIKSEHDEYRKKYEFRRKETKKEEIKKIFESFRDFFKNDGNFKFRENEHSLTAEYKGHGITLEIDVYKTIAEQGFSIEGIINTYEKKSFAFVAEAVCNKEAALLQPADADDQERMIHDTRFYRDFIDGEVYYTFRYIIKGRDEAYATMGELLFAL